MAAEELNDLIAVSAERERLWKALYERGLQAEKQYATQSQDEVIWVASYSICHLPSF